MWFHRKGVSGGAGKAKGEASIKFVVVPPQVGTVPWPRLRLLPRSRARSKA